MMKSLFVIITLITSFSIGWAESIPASSYSQLSSVIFDSSHEDYVRLIPAQLVEDGGHVTHPVTKEMGKRIKNIFPQSLFRGMCLNNVDELRNIVEVGLETSKTSFNMIYMSDNAGIALDYAECGGPIKLIFILDPTDLQLDLQKTLPEIRYYSSPLDISTSSLVRVLVFNPNENPELPFDEYTIHDLQQIFRQ